MQYASGALYALIVIGPPACPSEAAYTPVSALFQLQFKSSVTPDIFLILWVMLQMLHECVFKPTIQSCLQEMLI